MLDYANEATAWLHESREPFPVFFWERYRTMKAWSERYYIPGFEEGGSSPWIKEFKQSLEVETKQNKAKSKTTDSSERNVPLPKPLF